MPSGKIRTPQCKYSTLPEGKTLLTLRKAPWGRFTSLGGSPSMDTWQEGKRWLTFAIGEKKLIYTLVERLDRSKEGRKHIMQITWGLTPCAVRPSAPIMLPIRGMEMPCRVGEEVWGKVHAAVGDSCSLARDLPSGTGFRGFRGSVWRPRPGTTPPRGIR